MQAWKIRFTAGREGEGYQVMFGGYTVRVTDLDGNTVVGAFEYTTTDTSPTPPAWLDPDPEVDPPPPADPPTEILISKVALLRRATLTERVALEMAQIDNPAAEIEQRQYAATMRVWMRELEIMKAINLVDPAVILGIQGLESSGLIGRGRAAEILSQVVADDEAPNGV
jgi:hypothetical protein